MCIHMYTYVYICTHIWCVMWHIDNNMMWSLTRKNEKYIWAYGPFLQHPWKDCLQISGIWRLLNWAIIGFVLEILNFIWVSKVYVEFMDVSITFILISFIFKNFLNELTFWLFTQQLLWLIHFAGYVLIMQK